MAEWLGEQSPADESVWSRLVHGLGVALLYAGVPALMAGAVALTVVAGFRPQDEPWVRILTISLAPVVGTVGAYFANRYRPTSLGWPAAVVAIAVTWLAAAAVPTWLEPDNTVTRVILYAVALVGAAYVTAKLILLHHLAVISETNRSPRCPAGDLLPSQQRARARIVEAVEATREAGGGAVQLVGRWGDGKSYVVHTLPDALDKRRFDVVFLDIWQLQARSTLDLAFYEALLARPSMLFPFGWLNYPVLMLAPSIIDNSRSIRTAIKKGAEVEVQLRLPRLVNQDAFEVRTNKAKRHLVVVLDELDRATPEAVQGALTILHRALLVGKVTVVMPYVQEIIEAKAFSPLFPSLPDLGSTHAALLYQQKEFGDALEAATGDWTPALQRASWAAFHAMGTEERRRFQSIASQRYLASSPVRMHAGSLEDQVQVLTRLPGTADALRALGYRDDAAVDQVGFVVQGLLDKRADGPAVRDLLGHAVDLLRRVQSDIARDLDPWEVAAVLALAAQRARY
ncbi:MAG TPA: P-loop NTPase fold protein [Acidimicrobiales bacterium]